LWRDETARGAGASPVDERSHHTLAGSEEEPRDKRGGYPEGRRYLAQDEHASTPKPEHDPHRDDQPGASRRRDCRRQPQGHERGDHVAVQLAAAAGTGKTTALGTAARIWADSGYTVLALAPTARAAAELGRATGMPAETVAKWLHEQQRAATRP